MKLHCSISGLHFTIPGLAAKLEYPHPIFSLDLSQLTLITHQQWQNRLLDEAGTRLLCLALLKHTGLVTFKTNARSDFSLTLAECNIPKLLEFNEFLFNSARNFRHSEYFPQVVIDADNTDLKQLPSWLSTWNDCVQEYFQDLAALRAARKLAKSKAEMDYRLRTGYKNPVKYHQALASWAAQAASFPSDLIVVDRKGTLLPCSEYWQYILICMGSRDKDFRIHSINRGDISELQDWILDRLPLDSHNSFLVTELIKAALEDLEFFGGQNFNKAENLATNAEFIALEALAMPERGAFVNALDYFKALALYNSQQAAMKQVGVGSIAQPASTAKPEPLRREADIIERRSANLGETEVGSGASTSLKILSASDELELIEYLRLGEDSDGED